MTKKLMTLKELSDYLQIREEKAVNLIEQGVIPAYKIAGQFLRFQKAQIDAMRSEIDSRLKNGSDESNAGKYKKLKVKLKRLIGAHRDDTLLDTIADFFYFYDFYIISIILIIFLLIIIFWG